MNLSIGKKYQIKELDYIFNLTLLAIPNRNVTYYKWQHDDGIISENRQQDVDRWIKFNLIKEI